MGSTLYFVVMLSLVLVLLLSLIECVLFFVFHAGYFRRGPTMVREEWQTNRPAAEVSRVIWKHLDADRLVGRERQGGFAIRQYALTTINTYPRVWLSVRDGPHGAILTFEIRPFLSMLVLPIPLLAAAALRLGVPLSTWSFVAFTLIYVILGYKWLLPYDVKRIGRLRSIRRALASMGLRICEKCGYDLFGTPDARNCPECGYGIESSGPPCTTEPLRNSEPRP